MSNNVQILVTGAQGFVGSHTRAALEREGFPVREFAGDVRSVSDWKAKLRGGEVLLHLSGVRTQTSQDFSVNSGGVKNLFKVAEKEKRLPKKVIVASSQAVYMGCSPPFTEQTRPRPTTIYGKSKLQAEQIAVARGRKLGVGVVILRYSTVLGPGIREGSSMSGPLVQWTKAGLSGKPIRVNQDGKQTRDYIHVDAVCDANLLAIGKIREGIFNVGGGKRVGLLRLAGWVRRETGSKSQIEIVGGEASSSDPREMFSDTSKLRGLEWRPRKTPKQAVEEYVQNIRV